MLDPNAMLTHLTQSMGGRAIDLEVTLAATRTELEAAKAEIGQLRQQLADATAPTEQPADGGQAT
ncbi:hypothetical protein SAMN05216184_10491 [Georgenia satyanarayanai]|uniref:Uncharacterized protein n=1 Tax=Georgenia satyanarayanai TaxID=860221 RepID=A0A2Y9A8S0_9MICO|nr:hypothetical protein [Georgenia satyanarayanai]PYG00152.1 hypothetical protein A8987_10491 [Georgenia satyanarayanai]SSA40366.1 hypothetical protein SAMN05216184_10491 [Georgenia satyanarayanai]